MAFGASITAFPEGPSDRKPSCRWLSICRELLCHDERQLSHTGLTDVILEVGADRVLYSVDYPFEDVVEAKEWFDQAAISDSDRVKIARSNAQRLFRL